MKIQDRQISIKQFNDILKSQNAWRLGVFNGHEHSDKNFVAKWEKGELQHSTILDTLNGINTMIATMNQNLSRELITELVQSVGGKDTYVGGNFGGDMLVYTWLLKLNLIDDHKFLEIPQDKQLQALKEAYNKKFYNFNSTVDDDIWALELRSMSGNRIKQCEALVKNKPWFEKYIVLFEEYKNTFQLFDSLVQEIRQFSQDTAKVLMQTDSIKAQKISLEDVYTVSTPSAFNYALTVNIKGVSNLDATNNKAIVNGLIEMYHNKILANEPQDYDAQNSDTKLNTLIDLICALERFHPLPDYNCRTFCYLTLNRELMKNGFAPVIFEDPNDFDWMSREQVKAEIIKGQQNFQNLVAIGKLHYQDPSIDELSVESKTILNTIMSKSDCDWQTLNTQEAETNLIGEIGQDIDIHH